jgi:hypothetical protein
MDGKAIGLAIKLVPIQSKPPKGSDDLVNSLIGGAGAVRVLNAQDEGASVVAGKKPIE